MKIVKPKNLTAYKKWLRDYLRFNPDSKTETYYNSVVNKIKSDFEKSSVWLEINNKLKDINNEYLSKTGYQLLINEFKPEIVTKSFSSFLEKSFRKNVVFNKNWEHDDKPNPPNDGWITPDNWFERTNDILRTYFVVKYLDGVDFLMSNIYHICANNNLKCDNSFEARDEGYYAAHIYTYFLFDIPRLTWDTEKKSFSVEMQITTQLQDVISKLTHRYYEDRRIKFAQPDKKWQWDYSKEEFKVNYLGHILHYVEGMIMEVREHQLKTK